MTREQLRLVIRELLAEQLAAIDGGAAETVPAVHEELVSLSSDAELNAFAARVLALADDDRARRRIETGQHVFRLAKGSALTNSAEPTGLASPMRVERGLITEKTVAKLPEGVRVVQAGKQVRITPLAQDELRRRGVTIERTKR